MGDPAYALHTGNNLLKIREFWYIPKNHFFDLSPTGLFFKIENIDLKTSKCIKNEFKINFKLNQIAPIKLIFWM